MFPIPEFEELRLPKKKYGWAYGRVEDLEDFLNECNESDREIVNFAIHNDGNNFQIIYFDLI